MRDHLAMTIKQSLNTLELEELKDRGRPIGRRTRGARNHGQSREQ